MVEFQHDIEKCLEILNGGGVILYPTDTVWGLGCDATNAEAVDKIFRIKKRTDEKSLIVLVADEREILKYTAAPDLAVFDWLDKTDRPTTVIYEHAIGLAENVIASDGSIAIRICEEIFCKHLIKRFRKPIVSSSANLSGHTTSTIFSLIDDEIKKQVDYIVKYRQDDETISQPSAIIRWKNGAPEFIRG
jgi:L-threonylcarbamoyladenylate synthase